MWWNKISWSRTLITHRKHFPKKLSLYAFPFRVVSSSLLFYSCGKVIYSGSVEPKRKQMSELTGTGYHLSMECERNTLNKGFDLKY